jgi:hypothetical protein
MEERGKENIEKVRMNERKILKNQRENEREIILI